MSSCSNSSKYVNITLTPLELKDKRFLDTLEESTTFYFDIFNFDGYDRFGNTVFEDLKYRIVSRSSVEGNEAEIASFEALITRKGLHTKYTVFGIFRKEPLLTRASEDDGSSPTEVVIRPEEFEIPESVSLLIQSKTSERKSEKISHFDAKKLEDSTETNEASTVIIVACFRESYFEENMLKKYSNDRFDVGFYRAKGWVRVYLKDLSANRISEVYNIFPDAWPIKYGE